MAYTKAKHRKILNPDNQGYRSENMRTVNSKKYPDGYLYILKVEGFDIYKVGVSQSPKRRISDIVKNNPFEIKTLLLIKFKDVYDVEKAVVDAYSQNIIKGEWFNSYTDCMDQTISVLKELHTIENGTNR